MLWVFYVIPYVHPNSLLVVTINGTRMLLESIYITIFFIFPPHRLRMRLLKYLAAELLFMQIVIAVVPTAAHTHDKRSIIAGILCVIIETYMYASPLLVMKLVIQTKSIKYMPFYLSLAAFLNGISNGLGALLGLAQLILYSCYYSSTPRGVAPKPEEVELPIRGPTVF